MGLNINSFTPKEFTGVGLDSKISKEVNVTSSAQNETKTALILKLNANGVEHRISIISHSPDAQVAKAEILGKMTKISTLLQDSGVGWKQLITKQNVTTKILNKFKGLQSSKSTITSSISKLIKNTMPSISLANVAKETVNQLNKLINPQPSKLSQYQKQNLQNFNQQFDKQITRESLKNKTILQEMESAKGQDKDDLMNKQASVGRQLEKNQALFSKLSDEADGLSLYKSINQNANPKDISDAKEIIDINISQAELQIQKFSESSDKLISLTTSKNSEKAEDLKNEKNNILDGCRENIQESKDRKEYPLLWGMTKSSEIDPSGNLDTRQPGAVDMVNGVCVNLRLNNGELMPGFAEKFHKEVLLGEFLKGHFDSGLKKQGIGDYTPEEQASNLAVFQQLNKAGGEELNEMFTTLCAAYKARAENPQKYLNLATAFVEKLNDFS